MRHVHAADSRRKPDFKLWLIWNVGRLGDGSVPFLNNVFLDPDFPRNADFVAVARHLATGGYRDADIGAGLKLFMQFETECAAALRRAA
jgi:hypothetical protein